MTHFIRIQSNVKFDFKACLLFGLPTIDIGQLVSEWENSNNTDKPKSATLDHLIKNLHKNTKEKNP